VNLIGDSSSPHDRGQHSVGKIRETLSQKGKYLTFPTVVSEPSLHDTSPELIHSY